MKIEKGRRVKLEYTLTLEGQIVEASSQKGPLEFRVGTGEVPLPELEAQLMGLEQGDEKEGKFPIPGEYEKQTLPISQFPKGANLVPRELFEASRPDGGTVFFRIIEVTDQEVFVEIVPHMHYKVRVLEVTKF